MPTLNTATSIVDFLRSQNKPSDFSSRKGLYDVQGFAGAFGDYRGTAEQNTALLNKLKTPAPVTPTRPSVPEGFSLDPATNITTRTGGPTPTVGPTTRDVIDQTGPSTISSAFDLALSDAEKAKQAEQGDLSLQLGAQTTRGAETLGRDVETLKRTAGEEATALATRGQQEITKTGEEFAAAGLFRSGKRERSQAEIAQEVATKQASIQAKLGDQLYNTFTDFEKQFGTKFLESLSVPEAQQFTKLPAPVRGIVMQNYQEAIQKAEQKAQKGALDTLEKLGYSVVGGKVISTLERERFESEQARKKEEFAVRTEEREQARLDREAQREVQNDFRRQGLALSTMSAGILAQLRQIALEEKTQVSPGQIINASTGRPAEVAEATAERLAGYQHFTDYYVPNIKPLFDKVATGGAVGRIIKKASDKPVLQQALTPDQNLLLSLMSDMNNSLVYLKSGKQINEQEYKRLKLSMPDLELTSAQNKIRLDSFERTMRSIFDRELKVRGFAIAGAGTSKTQPTAQTGGLSDEDAYKEYLRLTGGK